LNHSHRLLLVEQLDAVGASLADLRPRARGLRRSGFEVRSLVVAPDETADLQHGSLEREPAGIERVAPARAVDTIRRTAQEWAADAIVWASAARGGGELAGALDTRLPAWWWPSGWTSQRQQGPLPALRSELDPGDAHLCDQDRERPRVGRLSLWDGPYALVASPLAAADAEHLFDGFARAADQRDEVDLVVLTHRDAGIEDSARAAGLEQRVHFVGPAPREAECAWLQHARVAFVTLHQPLSAGLVWRALGSGCPLLAVGRGSEPVANWLEAQGFGWARPGRQRLAWDTIAAALHRTPAVQTAVARGRERATSEAGGDLAVALAAALAGTPRRPRAA